MRRAHVAPASLSCRRRITLRWPGLGPSQHVQAIRAKPSGFLRDWLLRGAQALVEDLLVLSVQEQIRQGVEVPISVEVLGPLEVLLQDSGRGMSLGPEPGQTCTHAEYVLTHFYPVESIHPELDAVLAAWTWGERGSLGPVVANSLCEELVMESQREQEGARWRQVFRKGVPTGAAIEVAPGRQGTRLHLRIDSEILGELPRVSAPTLRARLKELEGSLPGVQLRVEPVG